MVPPNKVKSLLEYCPAMITGSDLGIVLRYERWKYVNCTFCKTIFTSGSTLTITMREEMEPVLYIKCLFSQETVSITEKIRVPLLTVYDLISMVTRKTGLPIGEYFLNENVLVVSAKPYQPQEISHVTFWLKCLRQTIPAMGTFCYNCFPHQTIP